MLFVELRKEISENNLRKQFDYREKLAISDRIIYIIVGILCFVDYNRIFLEVSNVFKTIEIYVLICISNFFNLYVFFLLLFKLKKSRRSIASVTIINLSEYLVFLFSLFLFFLFKFSIFFLFFLIDYVIRLNTIINIVA